MDLALMNHDFVPSRLHAIDPPPEDLANLLVLAKEMQYERLVRLAYTKLIQGSIEEAISLLYNRPELSGD